MGVKIYEDETKGRVIFDTGRRVRSAPLGGVVNASVYVRKGVTSTTRITISRTDKFKRDGVTPRRIFRRVHIAVIENEGGTRLVSGLGYSMSQIIDYINNLGTASPNEIELKKDGVSLGKGNVLDFIGFSTVTRVSKTLSLVAPTGGGGGGGGTGIGTTRPDGDKLNFGNDNDLQIYHDGTHSYISDEGTGNLKLRTNNFILRNTAETKTSIVAAPPGSVELYYDNTKKFETTGTGVTITGICTATSFSGDVTDTTGYLYSNLVGAPQHPSTINVFEYYQQYATPGDGSSNPGGQINDNTPSAGANPYYYGTQIKPGEEMVWTHTIATQGLSLGRWSGVASYVPAWASDVTYWSRALAFMYDHVDNHGGQFDSIGFDFVGAGSSYPITTNVTQLALRYRPNDYKLELRDLTNDIGIATATAAEDGLPVTISFSIPTNQHLPGISTVRPYSVNQMFTQNAGLAHTGGIHNWSNGPLFYGEKLKKGDELILTGGTHHWQVGLWGGSTTETTGLVQPGKWTAKWYFKPNNAVSADTNSAYGITGVQLAKSIDLTGSSLTHSVRWDYQTNKLELWEIDGPHSWHIDSANVAMGVTETYIHFTSYTDGYEPGGVSQKRASEYTKISAGSDPFVPGSLHIRDGFKAADVWKHNTGFKPGIKLKFQVPGFAQNIYYSNDYVGPGNMTIRDSNNYNNGDMTWRISQAERIHKFERCGMNTSYTSMYDDLSQTAVIPNRNCSWRYHLDNSWDIFDEDTDEVILTGDNNYDGNEVYPHILPVGGSTDTNHLVFDFEPDFNGAQWYCEYRDWTIGTTRSSWPAASDKVKPFTRWADAGESVINSAFWAITWGEKMRPGQEFQWTVGGSTSSHFNFQNFCIGYLGSNHIDMVGLRFYQDGRLKENASQSAGVTLTDNVDLTFDYSGLDVRIRYEYGTNKLKYYTVVNSVRTHIATADATLDGNPIYISINGQRSYVPSASGVQVYGWEYVQHKPLKSNGDPWYNPWGQWRIGGFPNNVSGLTIGKHADVDTLKIQKHSVLKHKDGLPRGYQMRWMSAESTPGTNTIGVWKTSNAAVADIDAHYPQYWVWSFQIGGDEDIDRDDLVGMTINEYNSKWSTLPGSWEWVNNNPGHIEIGIRYHSDNTIDVYDFTDDEIIATVDATQDGSPVYISGTFTSSISTVDALNDDFFGGGDVTVEEIPAGPAVTPVTKAVSFGVTTTESLHNKSAHEEDNMWKVCFSDSWGPWINMGSAPDTMTSNETNAQPFQQSMVFRNEGVSRHNDSVLIGWAQGPADKTLADEVHYIGISSDKKLVYYHGIPSFPPLGVGNSCNRAELCDINDETWYGFYMDYDGQRYGPGITTAQLNSEFRFKMVNLHTAAVTDLTPNWTHVGFAQSITQGTSGRTYYGSLRDQNFKFQGDIAQSVTSSLSLGTLLPDDTQVGMIVRDPHAWLTNYRIGTTARKPGDNTTSTFALGANGNRQTQIYLMGDHLNDTLNSQIENIVSPGDNTNTMLSMGQFDNPPTTGISTVSIIGLS